ncbi:hypothetical protein [Vibrio rumoiensis]|uniref:hypothetical protein n=1 Tax=Vibrio rumoiensis TaxID=76258 RepID=UPI003AA7EEE1
MNIFKYAIFSYGFDLPEFGQICLTQVNKNDYSVMALANSSAGIRTPFYQKAHRRQHFNLAGFFMRTISTRLFFVSAFMRSRPNYGGLVEAIARSAAFLLGGSSNLDQSTTSRFEPLGGGYKNYQKEASIMLTTPTPKPFNVYTFAIGNPKRTLASFKRIRTISTVAQTERQARANLKGLRLTFMKCLPSNAQEVAA